MWRTSLDGTGETWELRTENIHDDWEDRSLAIAGSLGGALYAMGGMLNVYTPASAQNDVYKSTDGGATWEKMNALVPWSPRAAVYGMPVIDGQLYLVGGGIYDNSYYDGVFAFDGAVWETICEDSEGFGSVIAGGRYYHNVLRTPDRRVWVFGGTWANAGSSATIAYSDDDCLTWGLFGSLEWGGGNGSHADAMTVFDGRILRASGNSFERAVYTVAREAAPEKPTISSGLPTSGPADTVVTVSGAGFLRGVHAVYLMAGGKVEPAPFVVLSDTSLEVTMMAFGAVKCYVVVLGPGGQSEYQGVDFTYT